MLPENVVFDVAFKGFDVKPQAANEAASAMKCADDGGKAYILLGRADFLGVASSINAANGVISASISGTTNTALANDANLYPNLLRLRFLCVHHRT